MVADPRREPRLIAQSLRSGLVSPRALVSLARWLAETLVRPQRMLDEPVEMLADSLARAGVGGPLRHEVLEPFFAEVLAEPDGVSSAAFARLLLRSFALGTPGVPAAGMQALPEQLARPLSGRITTGVTVEEVRAGAREARVLAADRAWRTEVVVVCFGPSHQRLSFASPGGRPR